LWGFRCPFPSAGWRRVEFFARFLAKKGFNIRVIGSIPISRDLMRNLRLIKNEKRKPTHNLVIINVPLHFSTYNPVKVWLLNVLLSLIGLLPVVVTYRPHIMIISIPNSDGVLAMYLAGRLMGSKIVIDVRDPSEEHLLRQTRSKFEKVLASTIRSINHSIYKRADLVVTVTLSLRNILRKAGIESVHLPNGADLEAFKPYPEERQHIRETLGIDESDVVLVFSGRLTYYYPLHKFLDYMAKAMRRIHYKERCKVKLLLVGENFSPILDYVEKLGLNSYVIYAGRYQKAKDLAKILSATDIGLIFRIDDPMFDYAIPAKFYEYVACGLPVFAVVRKSSELAKVIKDGGLGIICEPNDEKYIITFLEELTDKGRSLLKSYKQNAIKIRPRVNRIISGLKLYLLLQRILK